MSDLSDSSMSGSSDSIPQDGGAGADPSMMIALCVTTSTICLTCLVLICIIHQKSNC
jgi:hypothetical protein